MNTLTRPLLRTQKIVLRLEYFKMFCNAQIVQILFFKIIHIYFSLSNLTKLVDALVGLFGVVNLRLKARTIQLQSLLFIAALAKGAVSKRDTCMCNGNLSVLCRQCETH